MELFFDPLTRGPVWASSFLAALLSVIGLITFHAKKPLLGEVVAHCSYPGAIIGLIISIATVQIENPILILFVAFVFALVGLLILKKMEGFISQDSSMTLVLSGFFGFGVLLTSILQQTYPKFYRLAQGYLFGQVSTMTDIHIWLYGLIFALTTCLIAINYEKIALRLFDPIQAKLFKFHKLDYLLEVLICIALVLGIRGIGVVLVSSFFIAPSIIAKRFCQRFKANLIFAGCLAVLVNIIAFKFSFKLPLAPLVVMILSTLAAMSLVRREHATLS
jgi:manganese/zinc/iron transport system permease protein